MAAGGRVLQGLLAEPERQPLHPHVLAAVLQGQVRRAGRLRVRVRLRGTSMLEM